MRVSMTGDTNRTAPASGEPVGPGPGDELAPAGLLALVEAERARTSAAIEPDPRVVYGARGLGWLLGSAALRQLLSLPAESPGG